MHMLHNGPLTLTDSIYIYSIIFYLCTTSGYTIYISGQLESCKKTE